MRELLAKFTPRDLIVILLLVLNAYLVSNGHNELRYDLVDIAEQTAHICDYVSR